MRSKWAGFSGIEQRKDEQLPKGNCRLCSITKTMTFHMAGTIRQQRAYRNCFRNDEAYQHQDHPVLC